MGLSLKNRVTVLSTVSFLIIVACTNDLKESTAGKEKETCATGKQFVNPNGSSELALLMRKMLHLSDSLKQLIRKGGVPDEFPEDFLKIYSAKATDSDTKKASFNGYAANYLSRLKALYNSPKSEISKNYNLVNDACLSCHSEHCPGPVKVIKKLWIE